MLTSLVLVVDCPSSCLVICEGWAAVRAAVQDLVEGERDDHVRAGAGGIHVRCGDRACAVALLHQSVDFCAGMSCIASSAWPTIEGRDRHFAQAVHEEAALAGVLAHLHSQRRGSTTTS